jgi:hypothetical protein
MHAADKVRAAAETPAALASKAAAPAIPGSSARGGFIGRAARQPLIIPANFCSDDVLEALRGNANE